MILRNKALFLDRDGVINRDIGYLYQPEDFEFMPGIFDLCRTASRKGYKIVVVTNQSGIARGYYSREQFQRLTQWMVRQFWLQGIKITYVNHCPHHPKIEGRSCRCRKPRPGMLVESAHKLGISLTRSLMVGDKVSDMKAANLAGIKKRFLYRSNLSAVRPKRPSSRYVNIAHLKQIERYL